MRFEKEWLEEMYQEKMCEAAITRDDFIAEFKEDIWQRALEEGDIQ